MATFNKLLLSLLLVLFFIASCSSDDDSVQSQVELIGVCVDELLNVYESYEEFKEDTGVGDLVILTVFEGVEIVDVRFLTSRPVSKGVLYHIADASCWVEVENRKVAYLDVPTGHGMETNVLIDRAKDFDDIDKLTETINRATAEEYVFLYEGLRVQIKEINRIEN